MNIVRRLLRDRDEVVKELSHLQDQMLKIRKLISNLQDDTNDILYSMNDAGLEENNVRIGKR